MYQVEQNTGDIVISGFQNGIADDPYSGISDERNVNIVSVPGEASVNFATSRTSSIAATGTMVSSSGATLTFNTSIANLDNGQAIYFTNLSDATKGLSNSTPYWVDNISGLTLNVYSNFARTVLITTSASLTGTWTAYTVSTPKYFTTNNNGNYYMVDDTGKVWTNTKTTTTNGYWIYAGNNYVNDVGVPNQDTNANGNGIVYYPSSATSNPGYVFVFRNSAIDYFNVNGTAIAWTYGWDYLTGTTGNANGSCGFVTPVGTNNPHEAFLAPDNKVYFCDANYVGRFYEKNPSVPFVPSTAATYVADKTALLPTADTAQCLAWLGTNVLVGGTFDVIYPWTPTETTFNYPILLAERGITKMVTVNTNTYCFVGNRGRIYITNGAQAMLWKKVPDHLSGTVEPYFTWRGATSIKNQIYFSFTATTNGGTNLNNYSGLWAVDVDTKAIRMTNTLSYGAGSSLNPNGAYALIPQSQPNANPGGTGLYIGWASGTNPNAFGIDTTISTIYTGGQAYVISDMIPIGTLRKPSAPMQLEYKLSTPLLASETVELQWASNLTGTFTSIGTTTGSASVTILSDNFPANIPVAGIQWILVKAILTGKTSSPSYNRLAQLRITNG